MSSDPLEIWKGQNGEQKCSTCKLVKSADHFKPHNWQCRSCLNECARRSKRQPSGRAWSANSQSASRARALGLLADATQLDVLAITKAAAGLCHYCRQPAKLALDHVIPLAKGGAHTRSNLVMACKSCNSIKGARAPEAFAAQIGRLLI